VRTATRVRVWTVARAPSGTQSARCGGITHAPVAVVIVMTPDAA